MDPFRRLQEKLATLKLLPKTRRLSKSSFARPEGPGLATHSRRHHALLHRSLSPWEVPASVSVSVFKTTESLVWVVNGGFLLRRSLLQQLQSLQDMVAGKLAKSCRVAGTQTSSCLMVCVCVCVCVCVSERDRARQIEVLNRKHLHHSLAVYY